MIEDLRQRILITILFIAIYRLGSFVVLPGIDPSQLTALRTQTEAGLMSLEVHFLTHLFLRWESCLIFLRPL